MISSSRYVKILFNIFSLLTQVGRSVGGCYSDNIFYSLFLNHRPRPAKRPIIEIIITIILYLFFSSDLLSDGMTIVKVGLIKEGLEFAIGLVSDCHRFSHVVLCT